jgi:putative membrane protein
MSIQSFALRAALVAVIAAPAAWADSPKDRLGTAELQTLAHVHGVNQMEMDMGKLAEKAGTTQAIKEYGAMLVKDHGQNDKDLMALARKHGQVVPKEMITDPNDKQQAKDDMQMAAKLKKETGADFDRDFLAMMIGGHERELAKIDTSIGEAQAGDLVSFLKDLKPVLQHHLDKARDLQKTNAQALNP